MQKQIILFILLVFISCNKNLPFGNGPNNKVTIFVSDEDREIAELYLAPLFNNMIMTPVEENLYSVEIKKSQDFIQLKYNKNIIITSILEPEDSTGDLLFDKFYNISNKEIFSLSDVYSRNQTIICLSAENLDKFSLLINDYNQWILETINENIFDNYKYDLSTTDKELNIINIAKQNFNIDINIDENYKIILDEDNLLWIGRGFPYRWIVISSADISKDSYLTYIKDIYEDKLTNLTIVDKYTYFTNDLDNIVVRGLYEQEDSDTGGPFFTYIFENNINKEVIFISGFVNNPGKSKANLLLQLETIIKNIKVGDYE
tara:strand:- start:1609 stop:2559 length:951 start_codon:yes stop_codon:yes gene_type:complete